VLKVTVAEYLWAWCSAASLATHGPGQGFMEARRLAINCPVRTHAQSACRRTLLYIVNDSIRQGEEYNPAGRDDFERSTELRGSRELRMRARISHSSILNEQALRRAEHQTLKVRNTHLIDVDGSASFAIENNTSTRNPGVNFRRGRSRDREPASPVCAHVVQAVFLLFCSDTLELEPVQDLLGTQNRGSRNSDME
jgi:hypothetical protein